MLKDKLFYMLVGYLSSITNILLINTQYVKIGMFFGFVSLLFFVKALRIKEND